MESAIQRISQDVTIHCKACDYEGKATATRVYYTDCPECNKQVYVGNQTKEYQ